MREFLEAMQFLLDWEDTHTVEQQYRPLLELLGAKGDTAQQIRRSRDKLALAIRAGEIPLWWSSTKRSYLTAFGAGQLMGESAAAAFDQIFNDHFGDNVAVAKKVKTLLVQLGHLLKNARQTTAFLASWKPTDRTDLEHMPRAVITFQKDASLETLEQFKKQAARWESIFRSIGRGLVDNSSPQIRSFTEGSVIAIITLSTAVAVGLATIVDKAVDSRKKLLEIKLAKASLKQLGYGEEAMAKLEAEKGKLLKGWEKENIDQVVSDLNEWLAESDKPPLTNEAHSFIADALEKAGEFVEQGGLVRVHDNAAEAAKRLASLNSSIEGFNAALESAQQKLLPAAPNDEPGNDEPGNDEPGNDEPGNDEPGA